MIDAFRAELQARTRKDSENSRLVKRAFPKYNKEAREDVVLSKFFDEPGEIGKRVRRRVPKNVEEAIEKASMLEVQYELEKKSVKISQVEVTETEARFQRMTEQMDELKVQVAQLSAANTRNGRGADSVATIVECLATLSETVGSKKQLGNSERSARDLVATVGAAEDFLGGGVVVQLPPRIFSKGWHLAQSVGFSPGTHHCISE